MKKFLTALFIVLFFYGTPMAQVVDLDDNSDGAVDVEDGGLGANDTEFNTTGAIPYLSSTSPNGGEFTPIGDVIFDGTNLEVQDDEEICWGDDADWCIEYDADSTSYLEIRSKASGGDDTLKIYNSDGTYEANVEIEGDLSVGGSLSGMSSISMDSSTDPTMTLDVADADDTDWYVGVNADADADSDDSLEFRTNSSPGSNVRFSLWPDVINDTAWYGARVIGTFGAHTTGTLTDRLLFIDPTIGNVSGGTVTVNVIDVDAMTSDTDLTNLNVLNIGALSSAGSGTETAINIGSGYDLYLKANNAELSEAELEILDGATLTTTQLNYLNAATGTTGTTSTNLVFSTSPELTTPNIGVAQATSLDVNSGGITEAGAISGVTTLTADGSTDPAIELKDSTAAAGEVLINGNSTGSYDVVMKIGVEDSTQESNPYIEVDGVTETIDLLKPVVASGNITSATGTVSAEQITSTDDLSLSSDAGIINFGADNDVRITHDTDDGLTIGTYGLSNNESINLDFETTADTIEITSPSNATTVDFNTLDMVTTGIMSGRIEITQVTTTHSVTAREASGGWLVVTAAVDVDLIDCSAANVGAAICVEQGDDDEVVSVAVGDSSDDILYQGTLIGVNSELDSPGDEASSTRGAYACFICTEADLWRVKGSEGTWTDGGTVD